jgi:hypothetical protein
MPVSFALCDVSERAVNGQPLVRLVAQTLLSGSAAFDLDSQGTQAADLKRKVSAIFCSSWSCAK